MSVAYIGVGGNLGNVVETVTSAFDELAQHPKIETVVLSSFYESQPLALTDASDFAQPLYINAVARLETTLTPHQLLAVLQKTELRFGRVRTQEQWASRTLDLDIVLFDDLQLSDVDLIIPHAGMLMRDFVLTPLHELSPELIIPGYGLLIKALASCENRGLTKL